RAPSLRAPSSPHRLGDGHRHRQCYASPVSPSSDPRRPVAPAHAAARAELTPSGDLGSTVGCHVTAAVRVVPVRAAGREVVVPPCDDRDDRGKYVVPRHPRDVLPRPANPPEPTVAGVITHRLPFTCVVGGICGFAAATTSSSGPLTTWRPIRC